MLNQENVISEEIVAYNLLAPVSAQKIEVCLIPQNLCEVKLLGRFVTDGAFKGVGSESVVTAVSLDEEVALKAVQSFDRTSQPTIKEVRISVETDLNQINQGINCDVLVKTSTRKGETVTTTVKGNFDETSETWVYPVNEKMNFDKSLYYQLLSEISVNVQIVYA